MQDYAKGFTRQELDSYVRSQIKDIGYEPEPGESQQDILEATGNEYVEKIFETERAIIVYCRCLSTDYIIAMKKDEEQMYSECIMRGYSESRP